MAKSGLMSVEKCLSWLMVSWVSFRLPMTNIACEKMSLSLSVFIAL